MESSRAKVGVIAVSGRTFWCDMVEIGSGFHAAQPITPRRFKMQDATDMVTEQVREILDSINVGVYLTDRDRKIIYWNQEAERITGYPAEEVVGSRCRHGVLEHEDKDGRALCTRDLCPLHRSIITDQPSDSPLLVFATTRRGERKPFSTRTAPLHNADGEVIGGIEVFSDESENMEKLTLARTAQRHMLSEKLQGDDRISFDVEYAPVEMIGGDYYYFQPIPEDGYALFLADVAGHGVSAALYTSLLHSLARECRDDLIDPGAFLTGVNERLCARLPEVGFITAVAAVFHPEARRITWCSAGHPPPFIYRAAQDQVEIVETHHFPLGLPDANGYEYEEINVKAGDRFLLYTDGATELWVDDDNELGIRGFARVVEQLSPKGGSHRLGEIYDGLVARCHSHMPEDDITLLSALML
jgi:PAS domain S-box-containing protein